MWRNNRKEEQQTMINDIENFKTKFMEVDEFIKNVDVRQTIIEDNARANIEEIHKTNERIVQAKELTNTVIGELSSHFDKQVKHMVENITALSNFTNEHEKCIRQIESDLKAFHSHNILLSQQIGKVRAFNI